MNANSLAGYSIHFSKQAEKQLNKLPTLIQQAIIKTLYQLVEDHSSSLDIKKLSGYSKLYRIRVGEYRVVYEPLHKKVVVYVLYMGHRKSIYDELKRLM